MRRHLRRRLASVRRLAITLRATGFRSRRYRKAWVFIDRNRLAQDNAEHLYRFVKDHHPRDQRLVRRRSRHARTGRASNARASAWRSTAPPEHLLLMLNCVELISSQIDHYIVHPIDTQRFGQARWRFTFLQHGVTKDDLSRWVNRKPISRFITATEAEYGSIAGDGTPYVFTDKEVRLTGFPRHDRLLRIAQDPRLRRRSPAAHHADVAARPRR